MPRAADGTYSLPAGNPVTTLTVISSAWANTTMSDLSTAMTASLDRSGNGAMLAGLKLFDGLIGAPGLTWGTETTSGLYRNAAGDFRWSITSTELLRLNTNLMQLSGTAPIFRLNESDGAANNKLWDLIVSGEQLALRVLTDALAATNILTVDRTAGVVDNITITAPAIFSVSGVTATPTVKLSSTLPLLQFEETDASADNKRWQFTANSEQFSLGLVNDAGAGASILTVDRTGIAVDSIAFSATTLSINSSMFSFSGGIQRINSTAPQFFLNETDAAVDNRLWGMNANGSILQFFTFNDAESISALWLSVARTGTVVNSVTITTPLLQAQGIHNGTAPTGTNNYIASGTYTPTATNGTNASAAAAQVAQWIRVGRVVIVSGQASCTSGGAGAIIISLSLPIASNLASNFQLTGSGECNGAAIATDRACAILGDTTNDRADFTTVATAAGSLTYNYTYVYLVN